MSKIFQTLSFYVLLLVFAQGLSSFEAENIPLNPIKSQFKLNELKNYSVINEVGIDSKNYQSKVGGFNGGFISTIDFNDNVSKSFFNDKKNGADTESFLNHKSSISYDSSKIKDLIPLEIRIPWEGNTGNRFVGDKGILYMITDYNDTNKNIFNDTNIEENTKFNISFTRRNKNKNYSDISCHLWKNTKNIINIFCKLNENVEEGSFSIDIHETSFIYDKYIVKIIHIYHYLPVFQFTEPFLFLYSKSQTINIEEGIDTYYLKFNIELYYNESLIIHSFIPWHMYIVLDECSVKKKELICKIDKSEIEDIYLSDIYLRVYYPPGILPMFQDESVDKFFINYPNLPKIDIKIKITKLEDNYFYNDHYFAYEVETNVKNISNLLTEIFSLKFKNNNGEVKNKGCYFKKSIGSPFYLLCRGYDLGANSLYEIKEEIILDDIHHKYNFHIQPVKNDEKIYITNISEKSRSEIIFAFQKTLDFSIKDEIKLELMMENLFETKGIRLNPDATKDLDCENFVNRYKRCIVPKSHFENKKSGYYSVYHLNPINKYSKFYEISPIKVILPSEDNIIIKIKDIDTSPVKIGLNGAIAFKTDFEDSQNIFDPSDIETKTVNKLSFSGNNKIYQAVCHLWKPIRENLRLICKFNDNIDSQKIKLNKFIFAYKDYNIEIISENHLNINQLNTAISFLYSDKQIINIIDPINEYNLIFKKKVYNKEQLILYKENNKMKNIYLNCIERKEKIKCTISKDKLVEILSKNGEKFSLSQFTESEGILKFENVFDIIINYENVIKKNINLSITKLLTRKVEKNNFVVFETKTNEDIHIITTDYFIITPNRSYRNDAIKCLFKKSNNQKDDKLYLLCNADSPGEYQLEIDETIIDDLNILYSFKISETHMTETVTILENEGTKIISVYPHSLNFTSHDKLIIRYQTENPDKLKYIKLNISSFSELQCKNKNGYKECIIPQNHFNKSGYYFTYYSNDLGHNTISYEIPKIQITLKKDPEPSKNIIGIIIVIIGCIIGVLVLIGIIIFIVIYIKNKKSNTYEIDDINDNIIPKSQKFELEDENKF